MLFVMTSERKDRLLQVRVSTSELEGLQRRAEASGESVSALVRRLAVSGTLTVDPDLDDEPLSSDAPVEAVELYRCPSFPMCGFKTEDGKVKCPKHRRPVVPVP